jgi:anti-sigma-K factor RskA
MSDHEELESSIAPWVLGAVEGDEADAIRLHVEGCASCRESLARLRRVAGVLAVEVDEVEPPARLRERILAAAAPGAAFTISAPARVVRRSAPPKPFVEPRRWGRSAAFGIAAAVMLALGVGLVGGDLIGRGTTPSSNQVARFTLSGSDGMAGATATVIELKNDGVSLVDFNGLPTLESGKVYEVWLITPAGRADPAGVFVPDPNGSRVVLVNRSLAGYSLMGVTVEQGPDGTSAPTQQPRLAGSVA